MTITDYSPKDNTTVGVTDVDLSVTVKHENGDNMDVRFYDGSDDSQIDEVTNVENGETATITWSNLENCLEYYWYVGVDDGTDVLTSPIWSFTISSPPQVRVLPADSIGTDSARLRGEVDNDGGDNVEARFRYRPVGYPEWTETSWQNNLSTGDEYNETITNLESGTAYEFETQGRNGAGESDWSATETFYTDAILDMNISGEGSTTPSEGTHLFLRNSS